MPAKTKNSFPLKSAVLVIVVLALLVYVASFSKLGVNSATTTINPNTTKVLGPIQEIQNVSAIDPNVTPTDFYCNAPSDCVLVHTTACFNNLPTQQACINASYENQYMNAYNNYMQSNGAVMCPQFFMAGSASCSCMSNVCSLIYNRSSVNS